MKRRVLIDIDGTMAVFHPDKSLEEVAKKGYSLNLEPYAEVCKAISLLVLNEGLSDDEYEVYSYGAYLNEDCKEDKNLWIDRYVPEIDEEHRLFCPYGIDKWDYLVQIGFNPTRWDILLDDFTKNGSRGFIQQR